MVENKVQKEWRNLKGGEDEYGVVYATAKSGHCGFVFSRTESGAHYIIKDGTQVSGPYTNVQRMADGFIGVNYGEEKQYIDALGRFSDEITQSGIAVFSYLNGYLKLVDLPAEYFLDDLFYATVVKEEKEIAINNIKLLYADQERISEFDEKRACNVASIIEAKRLGAESLASTLIQFDERYAKEREQEKEKEVQDRKEQDARIEEAFDSVLQRI